MNGDSANRRGGLSALRSLDARAGGATPARLLTACLLCALASPLAGPALAAANRAKRDLRLTALANAERRAGIPAGRQLRALHSGGPRDTGSPRARAAIVNGTQIAITEAPWTVHVESFTKIDNRNVALFCGGSILGAARILTAAHCVFNEETSKQIPDDQIVITAGVSDFLSMEPEPGLQESLVSKTLVHPYFHYDPNATRAIPDDVAVLEAEEPFTLNASAEKIEPLADGTALSEGTTMDLAGYGQEKVEPHYELDGNLWALHTTLDFSRECGGENDALFLCSSTPSGSLCLGDSGSGLTYPGSPDRLAGVADTVQVIEGVPCRDGAGNGFANLAAPEIWEFVFDGIANPHRAPRGGGAAIRGITAVGQTLTCKPGNWTEAPTFTYAFIDGATGQVLQRGASTTYVVTSADIGQPILCEVFAANAGGTGMGRTEALPAIAGTVAAPSGGNQSTSPSGSAAGTPAPATPKIGVAAAREFRTLLLAASTISVAKGGVALVKLKCMGDTRCKGRLSLTTKGRAGKGGRARTLTIGGASVSLAGGKVKTVRITLSSAAAGLLAAAHGHVAGHLSLVGLGETAPKHAQVSSVQLVLAPGKHG